jgi:hypothetical protein
MKPIICSCFFILKKKKTMPQFFEKGISGTKQWWTKQEKRNDVALFLV